MNETLNDPGTQPSAGPAPGPHQDLDRLRRSTTDRYVAGVAGGLGRHFHVDPTIIRVLLVVLTFFGGAGVLVYAVCWLFVPEDNAVHAPINIGSEPRKILLLAAAGVAFLLAMGDAFSGFNAGWPIAAVAVVIALVMIARDRRDGRGPDGSTPITPVPAAPPGPPAPDGSASFTAPAGTATEQTRAFDGGVQPPAWQPPVARPPLVPPHPKRTGIVWFWPTLALIGIGLGVLGIYDNSHHVADGAYPALALGIIGVMLLVGSVVGRPGGLVLLGLVSSIALAGSVAVGGAFGTDAKRLHDTPATAAAVHGDYAATVGEIELDLSQVTDPQALAGRVIALHLRTGYIHVIVPRSLNVDVNAAMGIAGGITVPGNDGGGINHAVDQHLAAVPASDTAPLELDINAKLGQITVEQR